MSEYLLFQSLLWRELTVVSSKWIQLPNLMAESTPSSLPPPLPPTLIEHGDTHFFTPSLPCSPITHEFTHVLACELTNCCELPGS